MKIPILQIKVGDRQRTSLTDIDKLASSIQRFGLLHPIVVDRDFNLIAGCRRLEAHKTLKLEEIEATFKDQLSHLQRREIELEENIQRVDLTWQEEVRARMELDKLKKELYGERFYGREEGWTIGDTAVALGESESLVNRDIRLARAMEVMPELARAKNKSEALNMLKREKAAIRRALAAKDIDKLIEENPDDQLVKIISGDCISELNRFDRDSVDLCIADPPFGVGLDGISEAVGAKYEKYDDKKEEMFSLYRELVPLVYRVLRNDSHFYLFFPIGRDYTFYLDTLEATFTGEEDYVDPIPLVWVKSTGGGTVNAYDRYQPRYQPIFFAKKGRGRKLKTGTPNGNVLDFRSVPIGKRDHPAEAPIELFEFLIDQSSLAGEVILDPFGGSGALGEAINKMKRRGIVIEKKEEYINLIKERVYGKK